MSAGEENNRRGTGNAFEIADLMLARGFGPPARWVGR
jgi:hypothetical protein